ncbi:MAG TPA: MvaI/BcnI family restriction endonuclease [Paludibacter sp.]|nr:MvaI/BcnI family restriction endonuclease [Paludibacter sp.]
MKTSKDRLIEIFEDIRDRGWVQSHRSHNTGIGKTFEDLAGITEDNSEGPDFEEFEVKAFRRESNSPITLFTLAPTFPKGANRYLKDKYGEYYPDSTTLKKLHTSMFADKKNNYLNKYSFQLINDRDAEKLKIGVYDYYTGLLIDDSVYYTYEKLKKKLFKKLINLFVVSAERRFNNGIEEFKFTNARIYTDPSFERFLDIIDDGRVQYDIRIGSYQSGDMYGKPHDHGSGFRLRNDYILALYDNQEFVQ